MKVFLVDARNELKRAEHILYVSLKYTRTVDVLRNLLERLITCLDITIRSALRTAKEKKVIDDKPENQGDRCEELRKVMADEKTTEMLQFYMALRKISRAEYTKSREFRRHVTMTAQTDEGPVDINLDISKEYFEKSVSYVEHIEQKLEEL